MKNHPRPRQRIALLCGRSSRRGRSKTPKIKLLRVPDSKEPYPLSWGEQARPEAAVAVAAVEKQTLRLRRSSRGRRLILHDVDARRMQPPVIASPAKID